MKDNIKKSFQKVKRDIDSLKEELFFIRSELDNLREMVSSIGKIPENFAESASTHVQKVSTHREIVSTHFPAFKPLKPKNLRISTGNEGVSTDRQTLRQTDTSQILGRKDNKDSFNSAAEILDALGGIKEEIKLKFKQLTEQEFLVFSTVYSIDREVGYCTYRDLSKKLKLTESSIRDYVSRLINKGIPVEKTKINNKTVHLRVSESLKKVVSLPALLRLREM